MICRCGAEAAEGPFCTIHANALTATIRQAPGLLDDLQTTVEKQDQHGPQAAGGDGRPLVLNLGASEAKTQLLEAIRAVWWEATNARVFRYETPARQLADEALYGWTQLMRSARVEQVAEQITTAAHQAHRVIDRPPERRVIGVCDCGEDITTTKRTGTTTCGCGARWDIRGTELTRIMDVRDQRVTTTQAVALFQHHLGVRLPKPTIDSWVQRGHITRAPDGIRVGDLIDAWETRNGPLPGRAA